jgi:quinol monooxygenase YgiN
MYIRLTYLTTSSDQKDLIKRIYTEEIVPVVKKQKGNLGVRLLESSKDDGAFISETEWESAELADLYQASGTYQSLVDKLKDTYTSKPVLKTFNVVESQVAVAY